MVSAILMVPLLSVFANAAPANVAANVPVPHIGPSAGTAQAARLVVPGPNLPSLEQLGVTSDDLFNPSFQIVQQSTLPTAPRHLFKRQQQCLYQTGYQASRDNAIACRNYLIQAGSSTCSTGDTQALLCSAGDAEIVGWNYYGYSGGVITSCGDAAVAASWIIDNCSTCPQDNCLVEGQQAATNNPNFVTFIDYY